MSDRVLITGGLGFLGRHTVCHFLEKTDWEIVVLDGLNYATDPAWLMAQPEWDPKRVKLIYHDLRAPIHDGLMSQIGYVAYAFNLASESHVDRSIRHPVSFVQNNVSLVLNLLEYVDTLCPEKVFQISTDEVYGPAPPGYSHKEWDTHLPSNPYSASKSAQESIAIAYWRTYGVPVIITNTMNLYGPGQFPEKFVPMCIRKLLAGEEVPVHAEQVDGSWVSGSRVWLHVRNMSDALRFLAQEVEPEMYPDSDRPTRFHVAGDEEISNEDMAKRIAGILGVEPKLKFVDCHSSRPGHDRRYSLDGSKLRAIWTPPYGLDESLERTVKSYLNSPDR